MTSDDAERLFLEAIDRAPADRPAFLADACGGDQVLLRECLSLVDAASRSEPYFAQLAGQVRNVLLEDVAGPGMPEQIGPWRILRLIARGGMGAVYLAERADGQYEARAALKILPVGIRDAAARSRFIAERQILARLVHDNITRLLDGGVTDDGTPYFVMDYVEGTSIDEHCDAHRLNLEQRLELILKVCDTVQFAHQNLIIHRDIKPGNVLVDANGTVRLLDFGIAKLLDDSDLASELTQFARRPLTPTYASPEMLLAEPVDVRTDVYSLGALGYRLLTGRLPLELRGLTAAELEERVRGTSPLPASEAVLRDSPGGAERPLAAAELAAYRRSEPKRLSARLKGDLDVILETALVREKGRRYGSVEQMAQDIRRFMQGLPIVARRSTPGYRAGKFLRRHRTGVAAGIALGAMLIGITGLSIRHAIVTERQSLLIAAERDRAEEVKNFLQQIFWTAEPSVSRGEELTARQILDRGALRISDSLHDRPELKADLLDTVADVYQGLGFFAEARPLAEQVVSFRRVHYGELSPQYGDAVHKLSYLEEQLGNYESALERSASAIAVRRHAALTVDLADSLIVHGRALHRLGRLEEARPHYVEALTLHRDAIDGPDERLATSLVSLGTLEKVQGAIDEAEALQREALQMRLAIYTEPSTELIESYYNLGTILHQREAYEEARDFYNAALAVGRKLWPKPEGHPDEPFMLNGLARVHESLAEYGDAELLFREAVATLERHFGDSHPNLGIVQFNLGNVLLKTGGCAVAEQSLVAAITILAEAAPAAAALANARSRLGHCRLASGDLDEAESLLGASFSAHENARGLAHVETGSALSGLIAVLEQKGEHDRASAFRAMAAPTAK